MIKALRKFVDKFRKPAVKPAGSWTAEEVREFSLMVENTNNMLLGARMMAEIYRKRSEDQMHAARVKADIDSVFATSPGQFEVKQ